MGGEASVSVPTIGWSSGFRPLQCPPGISPAQFAALPVTLTLRVLRLEVSAKGFRPRSITLVTTLLDPQTYPWQALGELYLQRWGVELHFPRD
jgi:hypothetical protein